MIQGNLRDPNEGLSPCCFLEKELQDLERSCSSPELNSNPIQRNFFKSGRKTVEEKKLEMTGQPEFGVRLGIWDNCIFIFG